MKSNKISILLADDDDDDCMFFKDALDELSLQVSLSTVCNGGELMDFLSENSNNLPDILFLDLNMPRKTGIQCLLEIKQHEQFKDLQVIIYSTSSNPEVLDFLYNNGAHYYLRKPADFTNLKIILARAITLSEQNRNLQPSKENFIIQHI